MPRRFSADQIAAFRTLLDRERQRLSSRLARDEAELEGYLHRVSERDPCAYLSPAAATEQADQESRQRLARQARADLAEVENALERIADPESFGICERCSEQISVPRLEMLPQTRICEMCVADAHP
jgi:RNA polymerase-binding transcription factor DksA